MSNPWAVVAATVTLIALSAFFVAIEFALLAAKRHRLEDAAASSRAARAALRSSTELTVMLAGCQLGITAATLALGAITKPAVHYWITPVVSDLGAPYWVADAVGFALALLIVTFLHLVVGEMAPKSWAIAHPERSATMLALPMRVIMVPLRPVLLALNSSANWMLRKVGVTPVDQVANGQNPDDLRHLVEHSVSVGSLELAYSTQLSGALDLQRLTMADLVANQSPPVTVPEDATAGDVRRVAQECGHLRILVQAAGAPAATGVVHVRDTLLLADDAPVTDAVNPVFELEADTPLHTALTRMRETANHLAIVRTGERSSAVATMADVLAHLFPRTTAAAQGGTGQPVPGGR